MNEHIAKILAALKKQWPEARCELNHSNALELLVAAILSAQCTDKRVNEVTKTLFKKYRSAKDYASASPIELEKEIRTTGFYRNKAKSIREMAKALVERHGWKVPQTMEELTQLPGVGRKTANVILGTCFGIPAGIVVDTHMTRLATVRLKLSQEKTPEKIEQDLMRLVPRKNWIFFSHAMVLHGRYICQAKAPRCFECRLEPHCPYPDKVLTSRPNIWSRRSPSN